MKLANTLALLSTAASSFMLTAHADDEFATPALRAATGTGAASSVISSFLEQADDIKAKLVVKKEKKSKKIENEREGPVTTDDPYANSRFEGICKDVTEEDIVNWLFCEPLCNLCKDGGDCCIFKHLGCDSNPNLSHLYEGFLEGRMCDHPTNCDG